MGDRFVCGFLGPNKNKEVLPACSASVAHPFRGLFYLFVIGSALHGTPFSYLQVQCRPKPSPAQRTESGAKNRGIRGKYPFQTGFEAIFPVSAQGDPVRHALQRYA
jgi:hypothetical protein